MEIKTWKEYKKMTENGHVLVDFHAKWCGPCKKLVPMLEMLGKEYLDTKMIKVDIDNSEFEDLLVEYIVTQVPTIVILRDGKLVKKMIGFSETSLREALEK